MKRRWFNESFATDRGLWDAGLQHALVWSIGGWHRR